MSTKAKVTAFYEVRHPVKHDFQKKTWWMRIGSATQLDTGQILIHVEAVPVNWNGELQLFPSKEKDVNQLQ